MPPALAVSDWDAAIEGPRPFRFFCESSRDGFGVNFEQEQADQSIRPITFLGRVTRPNERN